MNKQRPVLYVIGGTSRTGKTTFLKWLLHQLIMLRVFVPHYSTDILRQGIRYLFTERKNSGIQAIYINASVEFVDVTHRAPRKIKRHHMTSDLGQDDLTWNTLKGIIYGHDQAGQSLVIEGSILTPERISSLKLENLQVRAVFLGFSNQFYVEDILRAAQKYQNDWVYQNLVDNGNDCTFMREWGKEQVSLFKKWCVDYRNKKEYAFLDVSMISTIKKGNAVMKHLFA